MNDLPPTYQSGMSDVAKQLGRSTTGFRMIAASNISGQRLVKCPVMKPPWEPPATILFPFELTAMPISNRWSNAALQARTSSSPHAAESCSMGFWPKPMLPG